MELKLAPSIAIESSPGNGGLKLALNEIVVTKKAWCIFYDPTNTEAVPHLLGMPTLYEKLFWVQAPEKEIPRLVQLTVASGLFGGILILGLEKITQIPTWSKRWQLELKATAARGAATQLIWLYSRPKELLSHFAVRVRFTALDQMEIIKGHSYYEQIQQRPDRQTAQSA